jgi:hypothetical protein
MKPDRYQSHPDRLRQGLTVAAVIGAFLVNSLSNFYPINGETIGQISNTLFANVLITPANYAFAIWGVIYLGLIGFCVYQFLPPQHQHPQLQSISYLLVLTCLIQAGWVLLFLSRQFVASAFAIAAILLCLLGIYWLIGVARQRDFWQEKWLLRVPFSIYLGWISVATVVNVALALFSADWDGWGLMPGQWTVVMMLVAAVLGGLMLRRYRDIAYALVIVWALVAIAVRQAATPLINVSALGLAILLAGFSLVVWKNRSDRPPYPPSASTL